PRAEQIQVSLAGKICQTPSPAQPTASAEMSGSMETSTPTVCCSIIRAPPAGSPYPRARTSRIPGRPEPAGRPGTTNYFEVLLGSWGVVCARAATDETSAPAAKNGTSFLLSIIDVPPLLCPVP